MPYTKEQKLLINLSRLNDTVIPTVDDGINLDHLYLLSKANGLLLFVHHRLKAIPRLQKFLRKYEPEISSFRMNALAKHLEFDFLYKKFVDRGIPLIPIKGIYLSQTVYPAKELRDMLDIDIIFRYEDCDKIYSILKELNYRQVYSDPDITTDLLPLLKDSKLRKVIDCVEFRREGSTLEIHFQMMTSKIRNQIPAEKIWAKSINGNIEDKRIRLLCPEHQLINIATHCMRHNLMFGLRPIAEIDGLINYLGKSLNWEKFINEISTHDLFGLSYTPLYLSKVFFDSTTPDYVLRELKMKLNSPLLELTDMIAGSFFDRSRLPKLSDNTYFFHIINQKGRLQSLYNIAFPPVKLLKLKNRGLKGRFPLVYAQYPIRMFKLIQNYLPGLLKRVRII